MMTPSWNSREFFEFASSGDIAARLANGADHNEIDRDGRTPLHHAAVHGRQDAVLILLEAGAVIRADRFGWTPLHCAAAAEGKPGAIPPLLAAKADVQAKTDRDITPLHFAGMHGTIASIDLLLEAGAEKFAIDGAGRAPAFCALEAGYWEAAVVIRSWPPGTEASALARQVAAGDQSD